MVPPERHQTPDWCSLPSSHQCSRREDGAVFQAVTEEFQSAATTSTTRVPDAVPPYTSQHWLLLNWRQLRTKIDALLPSPAHIAQEHQAREATKSQQKEQTAVQYVRTAYDVGTPCYALYCGPRQTSTPRWVPATITRAHGTKTFTVKVHPREPLWKRHLEQLRPHYEVVEDADPRVVMCDQSGSTVKDAEHPETETPSSPTNVKMSDQIVPEYGRHNPRRSSRQRMPRQLYNASWTFLIVFSETFKTSEVLCMDYNSIVYMYNHVQPLLIISVNNTTISKHLLSM